MCAARLRIAAANRRSTGRTSGDAVLCVHPAFPAFRGRPGRAGRSSPVCLQAQAGEWLSACLSGTLRKAGCRPASVRAPRTLRHGRPPRHAPPSPGVSGRFARSSPAPRRPGDRRTFPSHNTTGFSPFPGRQTRWPDIRAAGSSGCPAAELRPRLLRSSGSVPRQSGKRLRRRLPGACPPPGRAKHRILRQMSSGCGLSGFPRRNSCGS